MVKSIRDALKKPTENENKESSADSKTDSPTEKYETEEIQKEKATEKN